MPIMSRQETADRIKRHLVADALRMASADSLKQAIELGLSPASPAQE